MRALSVITLLAALFLPSGHASASPPIDISAEELQTLEQAAQGDAEAQDSLGVLYAKGLGVPQNYAKARQWFEKAAVQGDAEAQYNLGFLYHKGQGVPRDDVKARQWWEKAAAQGYAWAQNNLGMLYRDGLGVPQDYAKARQWFEKAAAQGDAQAQTNLGWLYAQGQGVPRINVAPVVLECCRPRACAGAGEPRGVSQRAGCPQDYMKAREWYEQAAIQGYAIAQYELGLLYATGRACRRTI